MSLVVQMKRVPIHHRKKDRPMIFQKQKFRHFPPESIGDCWRTAVACMLNLPVDAVPHFNNYWPETEETAKKAFEEERQFLESFGLRSVRCVYHGDCAPEVLLTAFGTNNPGIYYLVTGSSRNGCNHVVIACDEKVVWDPAIDDSGIVGPSDDGYYHIEVYVPLDIHDKTHAE